VGIPAFSGEISVLKTQTAERLVDLIVQKLLMEVRKLRREAPTLNVQIAAMPLTDPASVHNCKKANESQKSCFRIEELA
jgi:hypothetical protein